jgi:diacylglycerol kinase family enzyme/membrane-associated phospholipid phosphatase
VNRFRRELTDADQRLFDVVADHDVPVLGPLLPSLSRVANHSLLWMVLAAGLSQTGGRRGKRAALRGVGCVAAASLLANQPAKRLFRRPRPLLHEHVARRFLPQQLSSSSFPSGHSASAFAFAVGAGSELPVPAFAGLTVLATGVAASRVYVGAHYPADVLAGSLMGIGLARLSIHLWPLPPADPSEGPTSRQAAPAPALPDGRGLHLVVNPGAGSAPATKELAALLPQAQLFTPDDGEALAHTLRRAARAPGCQALGVAGGDGTANSAAREAIDAGLPLLVMPAGTLNHLCRDLGFLSISDAAQAVQDGSALHCDVGYLDQKPFLNTASFGAYAAFVADRERFEKHVGKYAAMMFCGLRALVNSVPTRVELDGQERRVWLIFVGNGRYEPAGPAPSHRGNLSSGKLDIRLLDAGHPGARLRLLGALLSGTAARSPVLSHWTADSLHVTAKGPGLLTATDGELDPTPRRSFSFTQQRSQLTLYAKAAQ